MRDIEVSELSGHLSDYLAFAREGEEIVIREKDVPVARLLPMQEHELQRPPNEAMDWNAFLRLPRPTLANGASLTQALIDERSEAR